MANRLYSTVNDARLDSGGYVLRECAVGHWFDPTDGALRFGNLQIAKDQSIISAEIKYKYSAVGENSGDWKYKVYGIDEDNTDDFDSSPFGRSKTSASIIVDTSPPTSGGVKTLDVKSILEEITSRSGWSSGNNVGFILEDDGSSDDVYAFADTDVTDTFLIYRLTAEPDFFPTPGTVSAPTFPEASDYGLKVSKVGVDIGTASEDELLLTTRQKVFKVLNEGTLDLTSGIATYTHNLAYFPATLGYIKGTASGEDRMYKLNKVLYASDNDVGGFISSSTAVAEVSTFGAGTPSLVYLYTFIDPLT
jgi:hypothetical protein